MPVHHREQATVVPWIRVSAGNLQKSTQTMAETCDILSIDLYALVNPVNFFLQIKKSQQYYSQHLYCHSEFRKYLQPCKLLRMNSMFFQTMQMLATFHTRQTKVLC